MHTAGHPQRICLTKNCYLNTPKVLFFSCTLSFFFSLSLSLSLFLSPSLCLSMYLSIVHISFPLFVPSFPCLCLFLFLRPFSTFAFVLFSLLLQTNPHITLCPSTVAAKSSNLIKTHIRNICSSFYFIQFFECEHFDFNVALSADFLMGKSVQLIFVCVIYELSIETDGSKSRRFAARSRCELSMSRMRNLLCEVIFGVYSCWTITNFSPWPKKKTPNGEA